MDYNSGEPPLVEDANAISPPAPSESSFDDEDGPEGDIPEEPPAQVVAPWRERREPHAA